MRPNSDFPYSVDSGDGHLGVIHCEKRLNT